MSESPEELEARIAAYIDGELSPAEAARLEVFLANTDPKLAQQVISMIADKHALSSLPKAKAPSDLAARIMEQVERGTLLNDVDQFVTPRRPWWQSRAAVAVLLFLVFGCFTWFILQAIHTTPTQWQSIVDSSNSKPVNKSAKPKDQTQLAAAPAAVSVLPEAVPTTETRRAETPAVDGAIAAEKDRAADTSLASAKHADEPAPFGVTAAAGSSAPLPAAAPAIPPTTASPVVTEDRKALAQTESPTPPAPVLLTLAAESPDDFTRLRDAIASISPSSVPSDQVHYDANPAPSSPRTFGGRGGGGGGGGGFGGGGRATPAGAANENTNNNSVGASSANSSFKLSQNEQSTAPAMTLPQSDDLNSQRQLSIPTQSVPDNGSVSYHLSLTSAQLLQLTQQFHVKTLSDSFTTNSASLDTLQKNQTAAKTSEPPATSHASAAPSATLDTAKKSPAANLIDCIITMTPSAPPTPATSQPTK